MFLLHADRFHQTLTNFFPISGIDVDVFAVQAFRAVIGITGACDLVAAVAADKIFLTFLKKSHL